MPQIKDVTVHIDPEDDEVASPSFHLPARKNLEVALINAWKKKFPALQQWTVHYIDGTVIIDLFLTKSFKNWADLMTQLENDAKQQPYAIYYRYYLIHAKD